MGPKKAATANADVKGGFGTSPGGGAGTGQADYSETMSQLMARRLQLEQTIGDIDEKIYGLETTYLKSASEFGGLVDSWGTVRVGDRAGGRKLPAGASVDDHDRIFSLTSSTAVATVANRKQAAASKGGASKKRAR